MLTAWARATGADPDRPDGRRQRVRRPTLTAKIADHGPHQQRPGDPGHRCRLWFEGGARGHRAALAARRPEQRLRWQAGAAGHAWDARWRRAVGDRVRATRREGSQPAGATIKAHLPILVGGGGERVTLKLVARDADACNLGGGIETVRRKGGPSCANTARRSGGTIARSSGRLASGPSSSRDDRAEAERLFRAAFERNRIAKVWADQPVGTPEDVAERLAPYLGARLPPLHRRDARELRRGVE